MTDYELLCELADCVASLMRAGIKSAEIVLLNEAHRQGVTLGSVRP